MSTPDASTRLLDRYELLSELGRGGMGVVYRARDPRLNRAVAIKVVAPAALTRETEDRFRREAHLAAQLDHPAITPIYDFGVHEGTLFLVMPVIQGETLHAMLKNGALAPDLALEVVLQVAEALDYSHSRGVVHRDIKPENIMVSRDEAVGLRVRMMDFGMALGLAANRLTKTGQMFGTLAYFSPERAASQPEDGRSDLYALGTVFYEALAGRPPFEGNPAALLYQIAHDPAPPLARRAGRADPAFARLDPIVARCLAKSPNERYQRASDLARALRQLRDAEVPVSVDEEIWPPTDELRPVVLAPPAPPPLIGRERESAQLLEHLQIAIAGTCQFVLLAGEPGMGKTRLLQIVEGQAHERGVRILRGRFSDEAQAFPYQGFSELIQDAMRQVSTAPERAVELDDLAAELCAVFPMLGELPELANVRASLPAMASDDGSPKELIARTLIRLADSRPMVLLLEQLHGASAASIEVLQYVVRRLGPTPTLIVGTYRSNEVGRRHPLLRMAAVFEGESGFRTLTLGSLDADTHRALVESLLPQTGTIAAPLAKTLFETAEGNPYFTEEIVRSLVDGDSLAQGDDGVWRLSQDAAVVPGTLPATVQQAMARRVERLPDRQQQVLEVASVLGRSFDGRDLEALLTADRFDDDDYDEIIDQLINDGLLEEDRSRRGDQLHFASAAMRDVLYEGLTRRRRRGLHRRHARSLEQRHADRLERVHAQLVHHYAAGDVADRTIHFALELARTAIEAHSPDEAVQAVRTALEFAEDEVFLPRGEPADGDGAVSRESQEGELRLLLASAEAERGNVEEALREAGRAALLLESAGSLVMAAQAAFTAADTAWRTRRVEDTQRHLDTGIEMARRTDGAARAVLARLLKLAATVANLRGDYSQARALLEEANGLTPRTVADAARDAPPPPGGTLVTTLPAAVHARHAVPIREEGEVTANVFEPLLAVDEAGNVSPHLVAAWRMTDGDRRMRMILRNDVVFADGAPLDAEGARDAVLRAAWRANAALPPGFSAIEGLEALAAAGRQATEEARQQPPPEALTADAGVEVEGPLALSLRLHSPLSIMPTLMTDPQTAITRATEDPDLLAIELSTPASAYWRGLCGTGPFRIDRWDAQRIELVPNPRHWRPIGPLLERLVFRTDLEPDTIHAALQTGELDLARDLPPSDVEALLREPRFRDSLVEIPRPNTYMLLFNVDGPVSRDPAVRAAMVAPLRVRDLVWRTLGRFARPAACLIPPGMLGHDPGRRRQAVSLDAARAQLDAAAPSPRPLVMRAAVHPLLQGRFASLIEALFGIWRGLGIEIEVVNRTMSDFLRVTLEPPDVDLWLGRWVAGHGDPDGFTHGLFHSETGMLKAFGGDAELDALMGHARQTADVEARRVAYRALEDQLTQSHRMLPLLHDIEYRVAQPTVRRLRLQPVAPFVDYVAVGKVEEAQAPRHAADAAAERRGTVRVPLQIHFESIEPDLALFSEPAEVIPNVFESLNKVVDGVVTSGLAAAIQPEDGGRRFRVRLRSGVRFHDGRALTVRDVRYSFERLLREGLPGAEQSLLPILGARALRDGQADELAGLQLHAADELLITLEGPLAFFPAMLANPATAIVPEGATVFTTNWREGCAGTGPFRLVRFDPEAGVELEANPHYWRPELPRCARLCFDFGVTADQVLERFRQGRLSLAANLPAEAVETLSRDPAYAAGRHDSPGFSTYYLALNACRGPLADVGVRRALHRALTGGGGGHRHLGRMATPAHGLIPPGMLGYETSRLLSPDATDDVAAVDALRGLTLRMIAHPVFRERFDAFWQHAQRRLEAHGVVLELRYRSAAEMAQSISADTVDVLATRWRASYPDADTFARLVHSQEGIDGQLCGDAALDELIEKASAETEPALRHALYQEIEQRLARDVRIVPLFHEQIHRFARPEIEDLRLNLQPPEVAYEFLRVVALP
ncbi:MAG: ABC transporter substrate-binding protein [Acidobacteriota bacterium]